MGWREGIEMGLSLSNAYNRDRLQTAELAQVEAARKRQQGLWQAMDQAGQDTQAQIDQARGKTGLSGADIGLAAPARDPRVLRQGGYADEQSQAPQEQLSFADSYQQALGRLQQKAKIAQAAGDSKALLGVQDELQQLHMDAGSAAIKNRIANANADELGSLTKTISDNKRNNWQMKVDPKTGITTVSNGGDSVNLNRDQLGDLVAARWRLKQGDTSASDDIAKLHKSFVEEDGKNLKSMLGLANMENTAKYREGMMDLRERGLDLRERSSTGQPSREERLRYTSLFSDAGRRMGEAQRTLNTLQKDPVFMMNARKPGTPEASQLSDLQDSIKSFGEERSMYQGMLAGSQQPGSAKPGISSGTQPMASTQSKATGNGDYSNLWK